jgi:DNA-binding NtrC family response regulator
MEKDETSVEAALERATILMVGGEPDDVETCSMTLTRRGYHVARVSGNQHALRFVSMITPDAVVIDTDSETPAVDLLRSIRKQRVPSTVIITTNDIESDAAREAARNGAYEVVVKPTDPERLCGIIDQAVDQASERLHVSRPPSDTHREEFHGFIGASPAMQAVYAMIENAATSRASVFITGPSGTGKELCAQAIHAQNPENRPFVAINCAAIPGELMESEIFGHVKGAFTGASASRDGAALRAHGGTLFLDEICDLDLVLQAKLLRFVQTGSFLRVGSSEPINVSVRFICATNRDVREEVRQGRFREDLYYRLHVIPIEMPPLWQRPGDVARIARHTLQRYSREEGKAFKQFSPAAERLLQSYTWPGNVRESQNVIRNAVVQYSGDTITPDMLLPAMAGTITGDRAQSVNRQAPEANPAAGTVIGEPKIMPLWKLEREAIERALKHCEGRISSAAALLDISPSTLYRKLRAWSK